MVCYIIVLERGEPSLRSTFTRQELGRHDVASHEDKRIEKIHEATIYGILYEGEVIYVGATIDPLNRRLSYHLNNANRDGSAPLYRFIRELDSPREALDIVALPYDDEQEAIDDHPSALNVTPAHASEQRYDWTSEELDRFIEIVEAASINAAHQELGIPWNAARRAAHKLDLVDPRSYKVVDWSEWDEALGTMSDRKLANEIGCSEETVRSRRQDLGVSPSKRLSVGKVCTIYRRYREDPSQSYREVAEAVSFDVSSSAVGRIVRRDAYSEVPVPLMVMGVYP